MKFILAFVIIFCAVIWLNNNLSYIVYDDVTVHDLKIYFSEKSNLIFSKVGKDFLEIDWKVKKEKKNE
jgi:hypothetical protein